MAISWQSGEQSFSSLCAARLLACDALDDQVLDPLARGEQFGLLRREDVRQHLEAIN